MKLAAVQPRPGELSPTSLFAVLYPMLTLILVVAMVTRINFGSPLILGLLVVGVVVLGLPHGALDPLVATQLWRHLQSFSIVRFLLFYAATAALCAALWFVVPNAWLIVFLGVSAYHFGSDWDGRSKAWGQSAFGLTVVTVSSLRHAGQVEEIYRQLGSSVAHQIVAVSQIVCPAAICIALVAACYRSKVRSANLIEQSTLVLGGLVLPPLLFFTCYFCLLHSPRHLMQTARSLGLRSFAQIVRPAAPPVLATLVLAAGLWKFLPGALFTDKLMQLIFIGLAALTAPHMLLIALSTRHSVAFTPSAR